MVEDDIKKEIEKLKEMIQKKKNEIEKIRKEMDELNKQLQEKGEAEIHPDLRRMGNEISDLFNMTFNLLGVAKGKGKDSTKSGLLDLMNNLADLSEQAESFRKEFELAGKKGTIEYRISARPLRSSSIGHGSSYRGPTRKGVQSISLSNLKIANKSIEEKEPIMDVTENDKEIVIFAELPGLDEKEISLSLDENKLIVSTNEEKKNILKITLPKPVEKVGMVSKYRNGILEIRLKKSET